jgi:hypothetical protein
MSNTLSTEKPTDQPQREQDSRELPCSLKSIETLIAECWHGRDWHSLTTAEGVVFDRLYDNGYMRSHQGFIYSTANSQGSGALEGSAELTCSE